MDEYAATGHNAKRNEWFNGWRAEQTAMGLDSRFLPLKTPNVQDNRPEAVLSPKGPSSSRG